MSLSIDDLIDAMLGLSLKIDPMEQFYFDGLAIATGAPKVPEKIRPLIESYADAPTVREWTHPKVSVFFPPLDEVYLSSREARAQRQVECPCDSCKALSLVPMEEAYARTYLHELAHSTGSRTRLSRPTMRLSGRNQALEEIIAETVSAELLADLDFRSPEGQEYSDAYVRDYAKAFREHEGMKFNEVMDEARPMIDAAKDYIRGVKPLYAQLGR